MKNLVNAIRRNTEPQEQLRRAQIESDFSAFRRKFAMAFASRKPSGAQATPDGDSTPQDKPEPSKRKTARGKPAKR